MLKSDFSKFSFTNRARLLLLPFTIYKRVRGFTLIELLLVLVIIGSLIMLGMGYFNNRVSEARRDRAVLQMEQILNAGLAYYINYSSWPEKIEDLKTQNYLPNVTINNPWGNTYGMSSDVTTGTFAVCTTITGSNIGSTQSPLYTSNRDAKIISGSLPMAYVADGPVVCTNSVCTCPSAASTCNSDECTVVSKVNIPGLNLNNARSINFAGLYHNSGCVPAPTCPTNMSPAIFVIPVSVSGLAVENGQNNFYPLNSFTAFAVPNDPALSRDMPQCMDTTGTLKATCEDANGSLITSTTTKYWRVCLSIMTEKDILTVKDNSQWTADSGVIMAVTRCVPQNEPVGSRFEVFKNQ